MINTQHLRWLLYKQESKKFPYRLFIEEKPDDFLILSVQERWPGPGKKIYCLKVGRCSHSDFPEIQFIFCANRKFA